MMTVLAPLTQVGNGAYHVAQLMTTDVLTVGPNTPLKEVAQLLSEHGISGVPVVEKGSVVGVVSQTDIVAKARGPGDLSNGSPAGRGAPNEIDSARAPPARR
jgi:CBS domain-containing protein